MILDNPDIDEDSWVMVIEDDLNFDLARKADFSFMQNIPQDCCILQLYTNNPFMVSELYNEYLRDHKLFTKKIPINTYPSFGKNSVSHYYGTACYLVKKKFIKTNFQSSSSLNLEQNILYLADLYIYNTPNSYILNIPIFTTNDLLFVSNIQQSKILHSHLNSNFLIDFFSSQKINKKAVIFLIDDQNARQLFDKDTKNVYLGADILVLYSGHKLIKELMGSSNLLLLKSIQNKDVSLKWACDLIRESLHLYDKIYIWDPIKDEEYRKIDL